MPYETFQRQRCVSGLTWRCAVVALLVPALRALAQWTAIRIHDESFASSEIRAVFAGQAAGIVTQQMEPSPRPAYWSSHASSPTLLASVSGEVFGMDATRQVGRYQGGAVIWSGTPESRVSLHPAASTGGSFAYGIRGNQQVGFADFGLPSPGNDHAALWFGSAASFVDLHPAGARSSVAYATDGSLQGGVVDVPGLHAALWSGTAASFVDLNPAPGYLSTVLGMAPGQQVGWAQRVSPSLEPQHAAIWSGAAASWIDVHPFPGFGGSFLYATNGHVQVGFSNIPGSGLTRAGIWTGTAASFVNLHQFLPPGYGASTAYAVYEDSNGIVVGGLAVNSMGFSEAFIWTTVPSPAGAALLGAGLLASRPRRRRPP